VEGVEPALDLGRVDAAVAGHDGAVVEAHDEGGVVLAAVGVDDEAREARQDRGRAEPLGEMPRDPARPDVVGDVALHVGGREAEVEPGPSRLEAGRHAVRGVVAEQEDRRRPARVQRLEGRRVGQVAILHGHRAGH
jgi:hypothetical protein